MVRGEEPRPQPRSLQTEEDQENQENQEDVQRIRDPLTAELISWSNKGGLWGRGLLRGAHVIGQCGSNHLRWIRGFIPTCHHRDHGGLETFER